MNEISALIKETLKNSFESSAMCGHSKRQLSMNQDALARHRVCQHLDLGLIDSRTVEANFCCL